MEMLHMNINVDQLLKELESVTITALDDNALCCLGLKLRMALIVMSQQENLTENQRQTIGSRDGATRLPGCRQRRIDGS